MFLTEQQRKKVTWSGLYLHACLPGGYVVEQFQFFFRYSLNIFVTKFTTGLVIRDAYLGGLYGGFSQTVFSFTLGRTKLFAMWFNKRYGAFFLTSFCLLGIISERTEERSKLLDIKRVRTTKTERRPMLQLHTLLNTAEATSVVSGVRIGPLQSVCHDYLYWP